MFLYFFDVVVFAFLVTLVSHFFVGLWGNQANKQTNPGRSDLSSADELQRPHQLPGLSPSVLDHELLRMRLRGVLRPKVNGLQPERIGHRGSKNDTQKMAKRQTRSTNV